jgi:hypothetical protein
MPHTNLEGPAVSVPTDARIEALESRLTTVEKFVSSAF